MAAAKKPTATELKVQEAINMIPVIREGEGYVSPTRYEPRELTDSEGPEEDTEVEFPEVVVPVPEITKEEFERMKEVIADMAKEPEPEAAKGMRPGKEKMMSLAGGLYLPVRRRVSWMRGEPVPRPTWGIVNTLLKYEMGTLEAPRGGGPGGKMPKIAGGYAIVKSEVIDEQGRIIATGYAQERSEVFPDFIEKAETAAVGRAVALAGYGTETALDLDEGLEEDNVVDAPVRPIVIGESVGKEVKVGGRATNITNAQLKEIGRLVKEKELEPDDVAKLITSVSGEVIPEDVIEGDAEVAGPYLMAVLRKFSNDNAAKMIALLTEYE